MKPEYTIIHHLGAIWKKVSFSSDIERAGKLSLPAYNKEQKKKKKQNKLSQRTEFTKYNNTAPPPSSHPPGDI